jgi:glycosyltransferase involved in cell wall biosynthesis
MSGPLRVLFASVGDAADVHTWSGTAYNMYQALVASGAEVALASPLQDRFELPFRAAQKVRNSVGGRRYSKDREPFILRGYARQIARVAEQARPDIVFSPSSMPLAQLDIGVPTVFWTDATFAGMLGYYQDFTDLSPRHLKMGERMEAAALQRAALAVYSSDWAAQSAASHYGVPADRLAVVPFGANMIDPGPSAPRSDEGPCRLLTVGGYWHRKGVDLAVDTLVELRRLGVGATLDIVGCSPPDTTERLPDGVVVHGVLDKGSPEGALALREMYERASFFLLPSRAECTPIVLAEAAAYALPVVASATGGMAAMLREGRSGHLVDLADFAVTAAELLKPCWQNKVTYHQMEAESRLFYEEQANWDRATRALLDVIHERILPRAVASQPAL